MFYLTVRIIYSLFYKPLSQSISFRLNPFENIVYTYFLRHCHFNYIIIHKEYQYDFYTLGYCVVLCCVLLILLTLLVCLFQYC